MEASLIKKEELSEMLGIGVSTATKYIKQMNDELKEKGYLTIEGYIPKRYVRERFYIETEREKEEEE